MSRFLHSFPFFTIRYWLCAGNSVHKLATNLWRCILGAVDQDRHRASWTHVLSDNIFLVRNQKLMKDSYSLHVRLDTSKGDQFRRTLRFSGSPIQLRIKAVYAALRGLSAGRTEKHRTESQTALRERSSLSKSTGPTSRSAEVVRKAKRSGIRRHNRKTCV
jgi:hypothetical protein